MARVYGSTSARGYGTTHQKIRAGWKPLVDSGQVECHADPCLEVRDGRSRWIAPGAQWHLGHTPDRSGWTGPEHQRCGAADGATRGNRQAPRFIAAAGSSPVCAACGKPYHYAAKQCQICGCHYHPSRGVQYTCSRACGLAYRRLGGYGAQALPVCEVCGKPCPTRQRKLCSDDCARIRRAGQRKELTCEHCGKKFTGISARYCSNNCNALAYYYANLDDLRAIARERARNKRELARKKVTATRMTGMTVVAQSREW